MEISSWISLKYNSGHGAMKIEKADDKCDILVQTIIVAYLVDDLLEDIKRLRNGIWCMGNFEHKIQAKNCVTNYCYKEVTVILKFSQTNV